MTYDQLPVTHEEDEAFQALDVQAQQRLHDKLSRKLIAHHEPMVRSEALYPLSEKVIQHCWRTYQLGAGKSEVTARKSFGEMLQNLATWLTENLTPDEKCRAMITGAVYGPGLRLHYLNVRYRIEDQLISETLVPKSKLDEAERKLAELYEQLQAAKALDRIRNKEI